MWNCEWLGRAAVGISSSFRSLTPRPLARHNLSESCEAHANVSLFGQMVWTLLREEVPFVPGPVHRHQRTEAVIFLANVCARQVENRFAKLSKSDLLKAFL